MALAVAEHLSGAVPQLRRGHTVVIEQDARAAAGNEWQHIEQGGVPAVVGDDQIAGAQLGGQLVEIGVGGDHAGEGAQVRVEVRVGLDENAYFRGAVAEEGTRADT